jgi:hypothetical protein
MGKPDAELITTGMEIVHSISDESESSPRLTVLTNSILEVQLSNEDPKSQRDLIIQPRVARNALPWDNAVKLDINPKGLRRA